MRNPDCTHTISRAQPPPRPSDLGPLAWLWLRWLGDRLARAIEVASVGLDRSRQRRRLGELDDRMLRDIGLTRADAWAEAQKPFWRP
jgi:uncharacterized protein YjiS (DUF1127 family)